MKLITEYTESDVEFITEAIGDGGKKHMIEGVFAPVCYIYPTQPTAPYVYIAVGGGSIQTK